MSLTFIDQAIKTAISLSLPYQAFVPLIDGWLYLAHERNLQGSWLVESFNLGFISTFVLVIITLIFLLVALIYHGHYLNRYRLSVWADVAFLAFYAGLLSWLVDILGRGYILDYIQIPGIVTADLKDVLLTVAIAVIFGEIYDNPELSLLSR